jgi:hypothetical protein
MLGSSIRKQVGYRVGKKVLKAGYKRYGIPGAIASGSAAALGYVVLKRTLGSRTESGDIESAIDVGALRSRVSKDGIGAITNRETIESVVDQNELETDIDIGDVQLETEERTEALGDGTDDSVE